MLFNVGYGWNRYITGQTGCYKGKMSCATVAIHSLAIRVVTFQRSQKKQRKTKYEYNLGRATGILCHSLDTSRVEWHPGPGWRSNDSTILRRGLCNARMAHVYGVDGYVICTLYEEKVKKILRRTDGKSEAEQRRGRAPQSPCRARTARTRPNENGYIYRTIQVKRWRSEKIKKWRKIQRVNLKYLIYK